MNQRPVAWIDPKELDMAVSTSVTKHKQFDTDIPLYTHSDQIGLAESIIKQQELEIKKLKEALRMKVILNEHAQQSMKEMKELLK